MAVLKTVQIVSTPDVLGGKPRLEGRRISVEQIAECHVQLGWTIEQIASAFDLTYAEIYAALSYYHEHQAQIDQAIVEGHKLNEIHKQEQSELLAQNSEGLRDIMTAAEVAQRYGITDHAVRDAIRNNKIAARKSAGTWLIRREDADARWG